VDDAPWGFAPFHYGRWAWWGGRWCWVPGTYVARPVYAPALVGWVGGPSVSVNIHIGSGPVVGWVPLAPREVYRPWYPMPQPHWRYVNPHTPDRFYRPGEPPHGPVMYTNRGVPGGVTVVPADVLKQRQPVANVVNKIDPRVAQQLVQQSTVHGAPPPPAVGSARPAPQVTRPPNAVSAAPQRAGEATPPPNGADGRRGHGVIVPPNRREAPAAQPQEAPSHAQPPRTGEAARPAVAPSPPEVRRGPPPHEGGRAAPRVPQVGQPVPPPPPVVRSVPMREAEPRPAPNVPNAGGRGEDARRVHPQEPRENRDARHEGREGREGRPGGPRQQVQ
jgi:hypothetical protein